MDFKRLKKGLTDCTCKCGPHSVMGLDEPQQKVGVKIYVWTHDTDFGTTQRSVLWHFCPFGVLIWRAHLDQCECNIFFFLEHWDTRNCFLGICFKDVRECMSVAPPTEWVCIVLWLIPLFTGLIEFNTQTHWTQYIWACWAKENEQVIFLAFTGLQTDFNLITSQRMTFSRNKTNRY